MKPCGLKFTSSLLNVVQDELEEFQDDDEVNEMNSDGMVVCIDMGHIG